MADLRDGISPQLDELSAALIGDALDLLAEGQEMGVLVVAEDASGGVYSFELLDDDPDACLDAAREKVRDLGRTSGAVRYAIAYEAAIEVEDGSYADALLTEFGERGWRSYSAYTLFEGRGLGEGFAWSDPAPAGELDPLL